MCNNISNIEMIRFTITNTTKMKMRANMKVKTEVKKMTIKVDKGEDENDVKSLKTVWHHNLIQFFPS